MEEGNGDGWRDEWCCCSSSMKSLKDSLVGSILRRCRENRIQVTVEGLSTTRLLTMIYSRVSTTIRNCSWKIWHICMIYFKLARLNPKSSPKWALAGWRVNGRR